ncbi:hypothetical protein PC121_g16108 [Phytophthora cactorum]|nr:hypothetical protein PC121_g16108 [Phytophthora cactorum]KAG4037107.1 hypothetical protein PC123_g27326 [Phytophthora cactorum]
MPSASEIASRFGATSPPIPIPLYVCSSIIDDAEAAAQHFDPMTNQRRDYFIGLFHELRWHASKRISRKSKVPEWAALCQSWNAFVENFSKDTKAYRARITAAQRPFETFSRRHMIDRLHNEAMEAGIPCAVPFGTACSHCPLGLSVSLSEMSPGTRLCVYLFSCVISAFNLNVVMNVVTLRVSAVIAALVQALRLHSVVGFVPMYLGGEEILSNEYEDEPDLGLSLGVHSPQFARLSTESSHAHCAVVAAGAERYPSYGQPQDDRDSRALYDRVAALEQFHSGEFAQLQQELGYEKAQVAEASQTASSIQVSLVSQVVRLHNRVAALEKLAYASSSSSASHQG